MYKNLFLLIALTLFGLTSFSQGSASTNSNQPYPGEPCASSYLDEELLRTDSNYVLNRQQIESFTQNYIISQSVTRGASGVVYTIPVVFHIMHEGEAVGDSTNISYAQAQSCIAALNRDFRRTAADGGIANSGPLGVDAEIEFCMAQRDPFGDSTGGVTRHDMSGVQGYLDSGVYHNASLWRHDGSMKALVQWDPAEYLNIWVVNKIRKTTNIYSGGGGGVIGYATFPGSTPANDGIVIRFSATGNDPTGTLGYNLWSATDDGRVLTHEVGHYLNLYHTFQSTSSCGGTSGVNCATIGDRCCDTPPTLVGSGSYCDSNYCPLDNQENYMQYQNGKCVSDFTPDQVLRMRAVLASTGFGGRNDLVTNNNCIAPPSIDLELDTILVPVDSVCSSFNAEVVVCNVSSTDSVSSFDLKYRLNSGLVQTFSWTGNLRSGECDTLTLPLIIVSTLGNNKFSAWVDSSNINTIEDDIDFSNNFDSTLFFSGPDLLINQNFIACDSFVSASGRVWKNSGSFIDSLVNQYGCDSIIIYNITINHSSVGDSLYVDWAGLFSGSSNSEQGYSIISDNNGNVYTTGNFKGTVDFDPGVGTSNLSSAGDDDIFISKVDAQGNLLWVKKIGGIGRDFAYSITVDHMGNCIVTGSFTNTVDFNPGVGTSNLTAVATNDAFVLKLDQFGNFSWVKHFGAANGQVGLSVDVDEMNNVYCTGGFYGTVDFDPGVGTFNLTPIGLYDIYLVKLTDLGNFIWAKSMGGSVYEQALDIEYKLGNVYLTGNFQGTCDFDPSAGIANLTVFGGQDAFVAKYDSSGNYIWAKAFSGTSIEGGRSISVDNQGNVLSTGYFQSLVDFDPGFGSASLTSVGSEDIYLSKLDAAGNFVWAKRIGSTLGDYSTAIHTNNRNDVYISGSFAGTVDFDPNAGTSNITSFGNGDVFIAKYSSLGNLKWAHNIGGSVSESSNSSYLDQSGNFYITGYTLGKMDFDPTVDTLNLSAIGSSDAFIAKYNQEFLTQDSVCTLFTSPSGKIWTTTGVYYDSLTNSNGCDSILKFDLAITPGYYDSITDTVCESTIWRGMNLTVSGIYKDTVVSSCDSIFVLNLHVNTTTRITVDTSLCPGDSIITSKGVVINSTGTFYDTLSSSGSTSTSVLYHEDFEGAGHSFTLNTTDLSSITPGTNDNAWIVNNSYTGGSFLILGILPVTVPNTPNQNAATTGHINSNYLHIYSKLAANSTAAITNCNYTDSSLGVTGLGTNGMNFSKMTNDVSTIGKSGISFNFYYICGGSWGRIYYSLNSGTTWIAAGTFNSSTWTNFSMTNSAFDNQSTLRFAVAFNNTNGITDDPAFGVDEISIEGMDSIPSSECDSIITYNVIALPINDTVLYDTICANDIYTLPNGSNHNGSGIYRDTITASTGCDSIRILNLIVNDTTSLLQTLSVCDSMTSPTGKIWKMNGVYYDTIPNSKGCDSLMTFNLTISSVYRDTLILVHCDSPTGFRGSLFFSDTIFHDTVTTSSCDSIFTLNFTNHPVYNTHLYDTACDSIQLPSGNWVDSTDAYVDLFSSVNGCDSAIVYNILINKSTSSFTTLSSCDSMTSPSGKVWKIDGTFYDTIPNARGCDSLLTFNLTIGTAVTIFNPVITACDSIQLKGTWYYSSQIVRDTIVSTSVCDTIVVDSITIRNSTWSITTITVCDSLVSGSGTVYKNSGYYRDTMPNSMGCDSTVEYYLTVNYSSQINVLETTCDSFVSPSGNIHKTSGTYYDTLVAASGCDSTITTYLVVDSSVFVVVDSTICHDDSVVISDGSSIDTTGTYYDTVHGINNNILFSENFEGATHSFSLNTNDTNAITPGAVDNAWIVNNSYNGGNVFGSVIVPTPNQDAAVTGNIRSKYLHIHSRQVATLSFSTVTNTNYIDPSLSTLGGTNGLNFSKMTNDISTVGKTAVEFELYYLCRGSFGRLYYSLNSGATWTRFGGQLNNTGTHWSKVSFVETAFANQATIRFAVGFDNRDNAPGSTPGFAVDEIVVRGIGASPRNCDSITQINLTVIPPHYDTITDTVCDNLLWRGMNLTNSGVYRDTVFTACDTIYVLNLKVDTTITNTIDTTLCSGDSLVLFSGEVAKISGTYRDTFATLTCDSLIIYNVNVLQTSYTNNVTACDSFQLPGGTTVYLTGMYSDTLTTSMGCDSIINTNLTIGSGSAASISPSTCGNYSSPSGKTFTTTGMYSDTIPNSIGCDSIISINLTILRDTTITVLANGCDSYTLPGGGTATSTGVYRDTLTGSSGCDSIMVTNLFLGQSSNTTQTTSICAGETVTVGGNVYGATGTYRDTFLTTLGCDSIIVTNLTIIPLTLASITSTSDMCADASPITYTATPAGGTWSGGGIDPTTGLFDPAISGAGTFRIFYKGPGQCGITDSTDIIVYSSPTIFGTEIDDECDAGIGAIEVTLGGGTGPMAFSWNTGDTTKDLRDLNEGTYSLTVTDANGCSDNSTFTITNLNSDTCEYHVYLPNIFSPDGNGQNDVFMVEGDGIDELDFKIFNRWGNLIFESTSQSVGWDGTFKGKPVNQGVFVYMVSGSFVDGKKFEEKGTVTIVRR